MRAANHEETSCEAAPSSPAKKKKDPAAAIDMLNRRNSHSARSDCTTKPPPNESRLNSAESCRTILRAFASGAAAWVGGAVSTAGVSLRYTSAAAIAIKEYATKPRRSAVARSRLKRQASS